MAQQPLVGQGLLIVEASHSHSDTPHSVWPLWTSDQPDTETSTWKHPTLTRDRHPCLRRVSSQQSQQPSGHRPTPSTAGALGLALERITRKNYSGLMNWQNSFIDYGYCNVQLLLVISLSYFPVSRISLDHQCSAKKFCGHIYC